VPLTLYQHRECHECGLIRRLLRQYAVPFEAVTLPLGDKSIVRAKFNAESVPALVDGSFQSADLLAIAHHVERKYGARKES
jgi:glutathione S-transferase